MDANPLGAAAGSETALLIQEIGIEHSKSSGVIGFSRSEEAPGV